MYQACIFDLDGTLANTLNSIAYFANNALRHHGYKEIEPLQYRYLVGNGAKDLVRKMLAICGESSEDAFIKVYSHYEKTYNADFLYLTTVYDGILELLHSLKRRGFQLAVLSNKPHDTTKKVVEALFGKDYFELCYGHREGVAKKPNPAPLLAVAKELGLSIDECLYIGDTSTDMQTGKSAGMFSIGVLWGFRDRDELEQYHADLIVSEPSEILEFIEKG